MHDVEVDRTPRRWSPGSESYLARLPVREHVKREGLRLYGVEFDRARRMLIESMIQQGFSKPAASLSTHRSVHVVLLPDLGRVRVVYGRKRQEIVEVLAP